MDLTFLGGRASFATVSLPTTFLTSGCRPAEATVLYVRCDNETDSVSLRDELDENGDASLEELLATREPHPSDECVKP